MNKIKNNVNYKDFITTLNIHITKNCNFSCGYCYMTLNDIQPTKLRLEDWKKLY
jgi:molybdenum cofactor biosynthesis enzyme MoaA